MFKNIKIGTRLSLGFFIVFPLLTSVTVIGISRMNTLSNQTTMMYEHPLTVSNAVLHIEADVLDIHRSMKDLAMGKSRKDIEKTYQLVDFLEKDLYGDFEIINSNFLGDIEKYEDARAVFAEWKPIRDEVAALMLAGRVDEATEITKGYSHDN